MALQKDCPDRTNGIQANAYWVVRSILNNIQKTGQIELCVWKSKTQRDDKKHMVNCINIPILNQDQVDDENGNVITLNWADFAWKNGEDTYTKVKTLQVLVDDVEIDLSSAEDVL